jgi:hypothetical protein
MEGRARVPGLCSFVFDSGSAARFLRATVLRQHRPYPFLSLDSKAEVDEFFAQWKATQAKIVSEPEDKPWKLREFMAADLDSNLIRIFYDFRGDT